MLLAKRKWNFYSISIKLNIKKLKQFDDYLDCNWSSSHESIYLQPLKYKLNRHQTSFTTCYTDKTVLILTFYAFLTFLKHFPYSFRYVTNSIQHQYSQFMHPLDPLYSITFLINPVHGDDVDCASYGQKMQLTENKFMTIESKIKNRFWESSTLRWSGL